MRVFQYRLYPTKQQQVKLWQHANKLNWLYNYFLNQKIEAYKKDKISISQSQQQKELINLKETDPIIQEIHSQVLQQVPLRLDRSYQAFFRRVKNHETSGFPKFRNCQKFFGICYPQSGYSIRGSIFTTKIYGSIPFIKHRELKGNIKQVSLSNKNNKWYLNISTDYIETPIRPQGEIGIDIGLKDLVVDSNGNKIKNCFHAKYFDKQIAKIQSRKDHHKKGSKRYKYLSRIIQRLYDTKNRKINDFQHKVSRNLSRQHDTIFAEDLSVKTMSEGKWTRLNKAIRNAKLAQFLRFLQYKTNRFVSVNPRNTSKIHNSCGHLKKDLKLSDRQIICSKCGETYDRDINAAKNVLCLGQAILYKGCTRSTTIVEASGFSQK